MLVAFAGAIHAFCIAQISPDNFICLALVVVILFLNLRPKRQFPQRHDRGHGHAGPLVELGGPGIRFGGLVAVNEMIPTVVPGTSTRGSGPNGAGKATLANPVTGTYRPAPGTGATAGAGWHRPMRASDRGVWDGGVWNRAHPPVVAAVQ